MTICIYYRHGWNFTTKYFELDEVFENWNDKSSGFVSFARGLHIKAVRIVTEGISQRQRDLIQPRPTEPNFKQNQNKKNLQDAFNTFRNYRRALPRLLLC